MMNAPFTIREDFCKPKTDWLDALPFTINLEEKPKVKRSMPFTILPVNNIPKVDSWKPKPSDMIFNQARGVITLPLHLMFGTNNENEPINFFNLKAKRCYQGELVRKHLVHYINYFEKFYDTGHYLFMYYGHMKHMIDYRPEYTKENLFNEIFRYIFNPVMLNKIKLMNEHNYSLHLKKTGATPSLQYTDLHAKILMQISIMQKLTIPLVTHFITVRKYTGSQVSDVLMEFYTRIINMFTSVDILAKLLETVNSSVKNSMKTHSLWSMQSIRGTNATTHAIESVENIPLQLMPKYTYDQHIISFNFSSIRRNIGYKVIDISYGMTFIPLSSSQRDEDNNSKTDKFEAGLEKSSESTHLYIKANKDSVIQALTNCHGLGKFTQEEIEFFKKELSKDGKHPVNPFQQELVNYAVFQYFGDTQSVRMTNIDQYITMMIAVRRQLSASLTILPYVISGRVVRLVDRKTVNKKEMEKLQASPTWAKVQNIFRNKDIEAKIMSHIAVILSSEFHYIDYYNPEINGKTIELIPEVICEEVLEYILYINRCMTYSDSTINFPAIEPAA